MTLIEQNKQRWDNLVIPADKGLAFKAVADKLMATDAQARYRIVAAKTGVPWQVIAVIHQREANQNWNTQLGQGDPLNKKSTHVPKGRGPFNTWEEGAVDALTNCAPYASKNMDWTIGGTLALLEKYNGLGYANKNLPSPYIWAGTNQYVKGKYVADGVYDANAVDKQLGCAGLLRFMGWGKSTTAGTAAGGAVVAAGAGASVVSPDFFHAHQGLIISGVVIGAIAIGLLVHWYRNKDNTNVASN